MRRRKEMCVCVCVGRTTSFLRTLVDEDTAHREGDIAHKTTTALIVLHGCGCGCGRGEN
jgi:hypothetical protein